jgi:hypothetical protein
MAAGTRLIASTRSPPTASTRLRKSVVVVTIWMRPCASADGARTEHTQATIAAKHSEMALVFEELHIITGPCGPQDSSSCPSDSAAPEDITATGRWPAPGFHIVALAVALAVDVSLAVTACRGRRFQMAAWCRIDASG